MNKIDLKKYTFMTHILVMEDRQQRKQTSKISRVLHGENGKLECESKMSITRNTKRLD